MSALAQPACPMCDKLKSAFQEIESLLPCVTDPEEYDNLLFSYNQASKAIMSWKAHQLRSIQQDNARLELLENLDESSVLVTEDWAMKFLPKRYRECQTDWLAKRGLAWHIGVIMRKAGGVLQQQAFVHIIQRCNQDSNAVVRSLKKEHPEITKAFFASRQSWLLLERRNADIMSSNGRISRDQSVQS